MIYRASSSAALCLAVSGLPYLKPPPWPRAGLKNTGTSIARTRIDSGKAH